MSVSVRLTGPAHHPDIGEEVITCLDIDWPAAWRPDAAFWNRLSKDAISMLVLPILGEEWLKANIGDRKAVLVQKLGDIFAGKAKSITPEQTAAALAWQVPGMETSMVPVDEDTGQAPNPKAEPDVTGHENLPDHLA